tara:strand:- start:283 stop:504 length:222 start_codon:yes stop_codon:yes gene_type:complete
MISLSSSSMLNLEPLGQPSNHVDDKVNNALDSLKGRDIEVLDSSPFRSYASHARPVVLPQELDKVRSLKPAQI